MAQDLVYGTATVYGSDGQVVISGYTNGWVVNSADVGNEAEISYHKDTYGNNIGMAVRNRTKTANVDIYPTGSTITIAAGGLTVVPIPSLVTLSGFKSSDLNGGWVYEGGGKVSFSTDVAKVTLPLKQYSTVSSSVMVTAATS